MRDLHAGNVLLGTFPDKVECPTEPRGVRERFSDPIFEVVAVAGNVTEVEADPACRNDLSFRVWYDDEWAVCAEMLP